MCGCLVMFCWAQDTTFVVVTVCDLLQRCHFTADTFDDNTFIQMSQLSETTPGTVSEQARHVSTLDDTPVILEGLHHFGNCYRIITYVCTICINITNY